MNKLLLTSLSLAFTAFGLSAQVPGTLDPSFGVNGAMDFSFFDPGIAYAVAVQPDQKIVLAGTSTHMTNTLFVARLNPDGSPDNTFGTNGATYFYPGLMRRVARAIALQPDGKIVLAGFMDTLDIPSNHYLENFIVARLNADGSPDLSFSGDGVMEHGISAEHEIAYGVAVQPDGRIIASGTRQDGGVSDVLLIRVDADGNLDPSFDIDGEALVDVGGGFDQGRACLLQPDGKILVVGNTGKTYPPSNFLVARLETDGLPDMSFGADGESVHYVNYGSAIANAVALQPDGKIVAAGMGGAYLTTEFDGIVTRINADGSLDNSFGQNAMTAFVSPGIYDGLSSVIIMPDGGIRAGGFYAASPQNMDFAILPLNADGSQHTPFPQSPYILTDVYGGDEGFCLTAQADGKLLLAGQTQDGVFDRPEVLRYEADLFVGIAEAQWIADGASVWPNPARSGEGISLRFALEHATALSFSLADAQGRILETFSPEQLSPQGTQQVFLPVSQVLPAGSYFVRIHTPAGIQALPLMILR